MASYGQPYGATSPLMQHASPSPFPTTTPQQAANIQPGSITYTTTVGNDGQVVYHPFKCVHFHICYPRDRMLGGCNANCVVCGVERLQQGTSNERSICVHIFTEILIASYQTPQGVVNGIQWIPAEATSVVPSNATPAGAVSPSPAEAVSLEI